MYMQPYLVNFISTCTKLIYEVFGFLECALNFLGCSYNVVRCIHPDEGSKCSVVLTNF